MSNFTGKQKINLYYKIEFARIANTAQYITLMQRASNGTKGSESHTPPLWRMKLRIKGEETWYLPARQRQRQRQRVRDGMRDA